MSLPEKLDIGKCCGVRPRLEREYNRMTNESWYWYVCSRCSREGREDRCIRDAKIQWNMDLTKAAAREGETAP